MDIDEARGFLKANHKAVLATFRPEASLHLSLVLAGVDGEGRGGRVDPARISITVGAGYPSSTRR